MIGEIRPDAEAFSGVEPPAPAFAAISDHMSVRTSGHASGSMIQPQLGSYPVLQGEIWRSTLAEMERRHREDQRQIDKARIDAALDECERANLHTPRGRCYPPPSQAVRDLLTELRRRKDPAALAAKPVSTKRALYELLHHQEAVLGGDREGTSDRCDECGTPLASESVLSLADKAAICPDCKRRGRRPS